MKVIEAKKKYKNEWVLAEVLEVDSKTKKPIKIKVLKHSKNRDEVDMTMNKTQVRHLTAFYTGKIPRKGYAFAF